MFVNMPPQAGCASAVVSVRKAASDRRPGTGFRPVRPARKTARAAAGTAAFAALVSVWGCTPGCANRPNEEQAASAPQTARLAERTIVDLFAFGRVLGTVAPCGCTSDPLGGLAFAFGMIEAQSANGARLIVEPGSFLFPDPAGPEGPKDDAGWAQAGQRAGLLHARFDQLGQDLVAGLGPTDTASPDGAAALKKWPLPRVLGNLDASAVAGWSDLPKLTRVQLPNGLTGSVTAFVDPASIASDLEFPPLSDPLAAASDIELPASSLDVAMVQGPRSLAESIAKLDRFDVVVMGGAILDPERGRTGSSAVRVGSSWLLEPGDRAQTISHLRLSIAAGAKEAFASAPLWTVTPSKTTLEQQRSRLHEQLTRFRADPSADAAFLNRLDAELATVDKQLAGDSSALEGNPVLATFEQIKIRCRLPKDASAAEGLHKYDTWIAEANKRRFSGVRPPEPGPDASRYVGDDECSTCHDEAETLWLETRHARAFATLERDNKQFDVDCVGCHVTGFRQPGGSEVVENEGLRDVQCEQCHGPGSKHADEPTNAADEAQYIERGAPAEVCLVCHTPEHSDTFDYEAYLRDVLGPGHGARAREALGAGPTGRELRAAAIEKAGGPLRKKVTLR